MSQPTISLFHGTAAAEIGNALLEEISAGKLLPGMQLREESLAASLHVSRNTLREAFRLLAQHRLVEHIPYRGVFIAQPNAQRIREIYAFRRIAECGTLLCLTPTEAVQLGETLSGVYGEDETAVQDLGALNHQFHYRIVSASHSPDLIDVAASMLAELRLVFLGTSEPHLLHSAFSNRNAAIADALQASSPTLASQLLEHYLNDSLADVLRLLPGSGDRTTREFV